MTEKPVKEAEAVEEVVDVDALLGKLSKKNDEYVFKLRRILTDHQWSEQRQKTLLADLLPEILSAQHQGKPATQLYGPVTEKANSLIHQPKKRKKVPFWLNGLDLGLFFTSMFGLVYGITAFFNRNKSLKTTGNGLASLLIMALIAGFAFAYYNDWSTQKKDERRKTWQVMVLMVMVILVGVLGGRRRWHDQFSNHGADAVAGLLDPGRCHLRGALLAEAALPPARDPGWRLGRTFCF